MKTIETLSHSVRIYIAGDLARAEQVCREYCYSVGHCVTVTPTRYVYKGGDETGVIVGLINYPRFPKAPEALLADAEQLGDLLMVALCQSSFTVETPGTTKWFSRREAS